MRAINFAKKNYHTAVLLLFLIFVAVTMHFTVAFGDDYYYGSFFYDGFRGFVNENIYHYMKTNGRAFVHLLDEFILAGNQMAAWHIFGTLCIAAVTFLSAYVGAAAYKNGMKTEKFRVALTLSCLLFSFIPLDIARQSIYWATGALNYLFPAVLLMALIASALRSEEKGKYGAAFPIIAFFCAFSTEQCSAGAIAVVIYSFILRLKKRKKPDAAMYAAIFTALCGFCLLFLAPGNAERMTYYPDFYAKPFIYRIVSNIPAVANGITGKNGMGTALAMLFACHGAVLFADTVKRKKPILLVPLMLCVTAAVFIIVDGKSRVAMTARVIVCAAALLAVLVRKIKLFFTAGDNGAFFILLSVALQLCMLVSPEYGGRTVLVSVLLVFPAITDYVCISENAAWQAGMLALVCAVCFGISDAGYPAAVLALAALLCGAVFAAKKRRGFVFAACLLAACVFCFYSMLGFAWGYGENYAIHKENAAAVREWKEAGDTSAPLYLKYLKNGEYKYIMPYDNVPYHWNYYKIYNHIPLETEMIFDFPDA